MSREGSLEAPTRHALDWRNPEFYDQQSLNKELERVFDICHGCRRCVSLCNAFPTLFDLVDESETMEVDGVDKEDYVKVVDHCYLCDLCYLTKCPYVPPHEWNVDFPHLMLRAKAVKSRQHKPPVRDRVLASTDAVGTLAGLPIVSSVVNISNKNKTIRKATQSVFGIHKDAILPDFHSKTFRKSAAHHQSMHQADPTAETSGRVVLFTTCYGNRNDPKINEDLLRVFEHNKIPVTLMDKEVCCGMPKLELGDLEAVEKAKNTNIPQLLSLVEQGWDIVAPVPSCVLMFKQELPLMFPEDDAVKKIQQAIYDPFEYLMLRHKENKLDTQFSHSLGKIVYHASCHLRVQRIGLKTRDLLKLVPDTEIEVIERCSGHDGTYAVKAEFHEFSRKICRPIVTKTQKAQADHYSSDCPMAGRQIQNGLNDDSQAIHPMSLLRRAYGL
ncbi:heterodisulfide reductase-related iron-sulfur binding cluster [Pseudomonadota bacterium]